jgi:hypothetical protein
MGSETIPPCKENVVHITLDKPLEIPHCQFKLLRESSLVKSRAKEIHSRLEMPLNDRPIYKFNAQKITYIQSLKGIIPPSYIKYLLKPFAVLAKKASKKASKKAAKKAKYARFEKLARKTKKRHSFGPGFRKGKVTEATKDSCYVPGKGL